MIELSFWNFHEQNYEDKNYCLYSVKNGFGGVLYVGISMVDVWMRWFGRGGHITWDGNVIYVESPIGVKIENHIPDSLGWKIQLWTLEDRLEFCGQDAPDTKLMTDDEYKRAVCNVEQKIIKKLSPSLNRTYNLNPGKDLRQKARKRRIGKNMWIKPTMKYSIKNVERSNLQTLKRSTFTKLFKKLSIHLDATTQIEHFTSRQNSGGFQHNRFSMMICRFVMSRQTSFVDIFPTLGCECRRNFIFGIDRVEWAFRHASATVNASC